MTVSPVVVTCIGFAAQGFFSARILVQWIMSEKARRSLSPSLFWVFSLCGAYLFCLYGWLRHDFAIVLGQFISYFIYLWNLNIKGVWKRWHLVARIILVLTPFVAIGLVAGHAGEFVEGFIRNEKVPLWLLLFGSAGQVLFTLRFIYQWLYSRRAGESRLPAGFWALSLAGSLSIVSYGIIRHDIVLIIGQSFGLVSYIRNLVLIINERRSLNSENQG